MKRQVAIKNGISVMDNGQDDDVFDSLFAFVVEFILQQFIIELVGIKLPVNTK